MANASGCNPEETVGSIPTTTSMSSAKTYTQCKLAARGKSGYLTEVSWIPSEFAKQGEKIVISSTTCVWTVEAVYGTMNAEDLKAGERDFLNQRKVSDI